MDKKLTRYTLVAGLLLLCCLNTLVLAETQYVGDTLRVGVRAEPDRSLPTIAVIVTGEGVEVLERQQDYLRIRTPAGIEGWVKSNYLSSRKPAKLILEAMRASQQALQAELDSLRATKQVPVSVSAPVPATDNTAMQALKDKVNKLAKENRDLRGLVASESAGESGYGNYSWLYWLSGILAVGPLGFLCGLLWYRHQIMKKLGGLTL